MTVLASGGVVDRGSSGAFPPFRGSPVEPGHAERPPLVPLRPLGVGELLDVAVTVMRAYPRISIGVSALMYGSLTVLGLVLTSVFLVGAFATHSTAAQNLAFALGGIGLSLGSLASDLIQLLGTAMLSAFMVAIAARGMLGRPATVRIVWRETKRSLGWLLLFAMLLSALAVPLWVVVLVGGLIVAQLPVVGPYLFFLLLLVVAVGVLFGMAQVWLAPAAIVLEGVHVLEGIRRSWRLMGGKRWRAAGVLGLTIVLCLLIYIAVSAGLFSLVGLLASAFGAITSAAVIGVSAATALLLGSLLVGTCCTPFVSMVPAVAYLDMRMRAEGLDLTVRELRSGGLLHSVPAAAPLVGAGSPFAAPLPARNPRDPGRGRF